MQGQCGSSRRKIKAKKGGCGPECGLRGGSRRRRAPKKGGAYGVGAAITPGALEYGAAYTGPVNSGGAPVQDPTDPRGGYTGLGGRRRKTRKTRKTRKMRGGSASMGATKATAGFSGSGSRGLADYTDVNAPGPGTNPY